MILKLTDDYENGGGGAGVCRELLPVALSANVPATCRFRLLAIAGDVSGQLCRFELLQRQLHVRDWRVVSEVATLGPAVAGLRRWPASGHAGRCPRGGECLGHVEAHESTGRTRWNEAGNGAMICSIVQKWQAVDVSGIVVYDNARSS